MVMAHADHLPRQGRTTTVPLDQLKPQLFGDQLKVEVFHQVHLQLALVLALQVGVVDLRGSGRQALIVAVVAQLKQRQGHDPGVPGVTPLAGPVPLGPLGPVSSALWQVPVFLHASAQMRRPTSIGLPNLQPLVGDAVPGGALPKGAVPGQDLLAYRTFSLWCWHQLKGAEEVIQAVHILGGPLVKAIEGQGLRVAQKLLLHL
mmetsp:Transcript_70171/g.167633  ORF Transcript_70171/g.167633 Transcript_70171/m.167633 type:complete len:203 (-) Transcript_70171:336-944(-)